MQCGNKNKINENEKTTLQNPTVQELLEDDAEHKVQFCELIMHAINRNQLSSEWILCSL